MKRSFGWSGRGFALVEAMMLVLTVAACAALACVSAGDSRRRARLSGSIANLQQIGGAAGAYGGDHADRIFSFTWRAGIDYGFGGAAHNDNQAGANQAVEIIRRRANRPGMTQMSGWHPHVLYSALVLADYLELPLPNSLFASPVDANLLAWQRASAEDFFLLSNRPGYPAPGDVSSRWQFASSYETAACSYAPDAQVNTPTGPIPTVAQSAMGHRWYEVGNARTRLGQRLIAEVRFPASKAVMFEAAQRGFGERHVWFAHERARVPVLLGDGSAGVRATGHANPGFNPNVPNSPQPAFINYIPEPSWEPPTYHGGGTEFVVGRIRWTRSGLRGRDYLGDEVAWVP